MLHKEGGIPLTKDLPNAEDFPHHITYAIAYRLQLNSFNDLPKEKRPPRNLWDKPYALGEYLENIWDDDADASTKKSTNFYEYNLEDVE